ncbi:MAG: FtsW/RodA/SpoVE family cell cycle protein [Kiritimatiellae bacterium]|nr:FtsW/RodA/SpoVE family cell cycle protein [Kiritimatiellia bacterium]
MNHKRGVLLTILLAAGLLAAMGCLFCYFCPVRFFEPGSRALFWRQLAWNGIGLSVLIIAWQLGWRRLLQAAPWLMGAWFVAYAAAQVLPSPFAYPMYGVRRWLSFGPVKLTVTTCFMPVFALFVAWLHEKRHIKPWVEWTVVALAAAAVAVLVFGNENRMQRLAAFFRSDGAVSARVYMTNQLKAAFSVANWFGGAGRDLRYLPNPGNAGMFSASALLFGKWFPAAVVSLFAVLGAALTWVWCAMRETSKRRYALLFGLWLLAPAAYCLFHSLGLLPVTGVGPALASYGGTNAVSAWFGVGILFAMLDVSGTEQQTEGNPVWTKGVCGAWGAAALLAILGIALLPGRARVFAEPRPADATFGEFGLAAKRGRILAADGTPLAYTVRTWRFHLDPCAADPSFCDADRIREIADGLGIPSAALAESYNRKERVRNPSRYVFLAEVADDSPARAFFEKRQAWLTKQAGFICTPVQKRVYPLGAAATTVVGFMCDEAASVKPKAAGGIERACDRTLAGTDGIYDKRLPLPERYEKATPQHGCDVQTTLLPNVQKAVADALADACASNGAESAWGVVMKVPGGEIEAMASWPTFDPAMRRLPGKWHPAMAVNRSVWDVSELGGLVKPLTYAIALDTGVLKEDAKLDQEGGEWTYNGTTLKDAATNELTIAEALAAHANIAAAKTALRIGASEFHAALARFGFGKPVLGREGGVTGETPGLFPRDTNRWDKTTQAFVGMGYGGFTATGLQVAQAYAVLANHGTFVHPALIDRPATNLAAQVLSPAASDAIVRLLKEPMTSTVQLPENGKYSSTNYTASCAGFYPPGRPAYVVAVSFRKPKTAHTGEEIAKPVFTRIVKQVFAGK